MILDDEKTILKDADDYLTRISREILEKCGWKTTFKFEITNPILIYRNSNYPNVYISVVDDEYHVCSVFGWFNEEVGSMKDAYMAIDQVNSHPIAGRHIDIETITFDYDTR